MGRSLRVVGDRPCRTPESLSDDLKQLPVADDAEPGHLARDLADGEAMWPRLRQLVDDWPGRERWMG